MGDELGTQRCSRDPFGSDLARGLALATSLSPWRVVAGIGFDSCVDDLSSVDSKSLSTVAV